MVRQLVELPGRGISLEVDIHSDLDAAGACSDGLCASEAANARASGCGLVLLVLHPWAWLGGCMDDHVVIALCRAAVATGRFSHVVRYNMRGTGASGGMRALHASVDAADLVVLARQLLLLLLGQCAQPLAAPTDPGSQEPPAAWKQQSGKQQSGQSRQPRSQQADTASTGGTSPSLHAAGASPCRLVVAAYSYGTLVASRALPQLRQHVAAVAMVAMPLGTVCRIFLGAGGSWGDLAGPRSAGAGLPRLLCSGTRDQFASAAQLQTAVRQAQQAEERAAAKGSAAATAATAGVSDPSDAADRPSLELVLWPGCDHFFFDCRDPSALASAGLLQPYCSGDAGQGCCGAGRGGGGGRGGGAGRGDGTSVGSGGCACGTCPGGGESGRQLSPGMMQPGKALAGFVVGWLLSRAQGVAAGHTSQ